MLAKIQASGLLSSNQVAGLTCQLYPVVLKRIACNLESELMRCWTHRLDAQGKTVKPNRQLPSCRQPWSIRAVSSYAGRFYLCDDPQQLPPHNQQKAHPPTCGLNCTVYATPHPGLTVKGAKEPSVMVKAGCGSASIRAEAASWPLLRRVIPSWAVRPTSIRPNFNKGLPDASNVVGSCAG